MEMNYNTKDVGPFFVADKWYMLGQRVVQLTYQGVRWHAKAFCQNFTSKTLIFIGYVQ